MLTSQAREMLRGVETRDPRRGARRRRHEARRAPRALARAARARSLRAAAPAHRPLGDAAPARGDRPLRLRRPRRSSSSTPARARSSTSRSSSRSRTCASSASTGARRIRCLPTAQAMDAGTERAPNSIWPSIYPAILELVERAPLDDRLRQQPPARRAARAAAERARRGGDRARAPRLARARAARR